MIRGEFPSAGERTATELLESYRTVLAEAVGDADPAAVAGETGLDRSVVEAVTHGTVSALALEEAAAILALDEDRPGPDAVAAEARDLLLLGMTTAVLDVDTLSGEVGGDMDPKAIQQKLEGRSPITLAEYALLHHHIAARSP